MTQQSTEQSVSSLSFSNASPTRIISVIIPPFLVLYLSILSLFFPFNTCKVLTKCRIHKHPNFTMYTIKHLFYPQSSNDVCCVEIISNNLFLANPKYSPSNSTPMNFRFSFHAAIPVVPLPKKGSNTLSPQLLHDLM